MAFKMNIPLPGGIEHADGRNRCGRIRTVLLRQSSDARAGVQARTDDHKPESQLAATSKAWSCNKRMIAFRRLQGLGWPRHIFEFGARETT